jgi:hypothetical protein
MALPPPFNAAPQFDSTVAYFLNHEYHESTRMNMNASLIYRGLRSGGLAADGL